MRGRKMLTAFELFNEFSATMQFPQYFGENWDAFDECIRDIEDDVPENGYVLVISEPDLLL